MRMGQLSEMQDDPFVRGGAKKWQGGSPLQKRLRALFLLGLLLLSACVNAGIGLNMPAPAASRTPFQPLAVSPTTPPPPTNTPPTNTPPTNTATPWPTQTPEFTATATPSLTPTAQPLTTLLFTGVIVPARCVQAAIDARNDAEYIYDNVRDLLRSADLTVGTYNATMSDYPPHTGCIFTYVLVGEPRNADAMANAGFDVMSVATNHIKNCGLNDCGERAFFDTLDNLRRVGILPVGAGADHAEAMQPVVITLNGVRFGIVSLGMVEEMVFAAQDRPGIAVLNPDNLRAAIAAAREVSDVVIAMPHWGPEDSVEPNYWQIEYAKVAVEAGADLVVGNHTHVAQAYQVLNEIPVFYGLGNFVFDQTWDLTHQQGLILKVTFEGTRLIEYELIPTHVDGDGTVHLAGPEEAAQILQRVETASELLR